MSHRYLTILLTMPFVVWLSGYDAAGGEPKKVVVTHAGQGRLAIRISAELTAHQFTPVVVVAAPPSTLGALRDVAQTYQAAAVICIADSGESVRVWIPDEQEETLVQQEVYVPRETPDSRTLIAYKTVELLRARLLPLPEVQAPSKTPPEPQSTTEPPRTEQKSRLGFQLQPAVTYGFGKLPPTLHVSVGIRTPLWRRLYLSIMGLIPTIPMTIEEEEGKGIIRAGLLAAGLQLALLPSEYRIGLDLGAGVGPLFIKMKGKANEPYVSKTVFVVSATPHVSLALIGRLTRLLSLRTDIYCGFGANEPIIVVSGRDVTPWARPLLSAMLGIELWVL